MGTDKSKFEAPNWVGNLYQKFESICEDVDGIVGHGQDHVKYVGDQVQTVGESMKNFCSAVMQDLVIPLAEKKDLIASQVYSKKDEIQSVFLKRDTAKNSSTQQVEGFEKTDQPIDTQSLEKEVDAICVRTNDNQLFNASSPVNDCVPASPLSPHKMEDSPLHFQQEENSEVIDGLLEENSPLELSASVVMGENDASSCAEKECDASECWESDIEFDDSASHLFEKDDNQYQVNESPLEEKLAPSEVTETAFTCINYGLSCVNNEHEPASYRESDIENRLLASDLNQLEKIQINSSSLDNKSSSLDLSELVYTCVDYSSSLTNIQPEPSSCRESDVRLKENTSDAHKLESNQVNEGSLEKEFLPSEELELAFTCITYESSSANSGHETSSCRKSDIGLGEFASDSHQRGKDQVHEGSLEKKLSPSEEFESVFTCINYASCPNSELETSSCRGSDIGLGEFASNLHQHKKDQVQEGSLEKKLLSSEEFVSVFTCINYASCPNSEFEQPSSCRKSDIELNGHASDSHENLKNQVHEDPLEEKSGSDFTCMSYASSSLNCEHEPSSCWESRMEPSDCPLDSNQLVNWENQISEGLLDNQSSLELPKSVFTGVNDASSPTSNSHGVFSCRESNMEFDGRAPSSHQEERNEANVGSSEEKLSPYEFSESVVTCVTDASARSNNEHAASSYNESGIEFDDNELAVVGTPEDFFDGTMDTSMETISLEDEVKHPGSCAIVDTNVFDAVSHTAINFRSYKKKIRDAFTSKRRLEKEYKHLGIWYGDIDAEIECSLRTAGPSLPSVHVNRLESNEAPDEELCDWELL